MCSEFNVNRSDDRVHLRVQSTKPLQRTKPLQSTKPFQCTTLAVISEAVTAAAATNKKIERLILRRLTIPFRNDDAVSRSKPGSSA